MEKQPDDESRRCGGVIALSASLLRERWTRALVFSLAACCCSALLFFFFYFSGRSLFRRSVCLCGGFDFLGEERGGIGGGGCGIMIELSGMAFSLRSRRCVRTSVCVGVEKKKETEADSALLTSGVCGILVKMFVETESECMRLCVFMWELWLSVGEEVDG